MNLAALNNINSKFGQSVFTDKQFLHSLISTTPHITLMAAFPLLMKELGFNLYQIGSTYFAIRLIAILASFIISILSKRIHFSKLLFLVEYLNVLNILFIFFSLEINKLNLLLLISLKGLYSGMMPSLKTCWLKNAGESPYFEKLNFSIKALSSFAYVLFGILYISGIFSTNLISLFKDLLIIDAFTSILSPLIFYKSHYEKTPDYSQTTPNKIQIFPFKNKLRILYLSLETCLAFCFAGTNMMLFKYGELYFSELGGYGLAVLLYAIFFGLSAPLLQNKVLKLNSVSFELSLFGSIFLLYSIFSLSQNYSMILIACMGLLFFAYALATLHLENSWFKMAKDDDIAMIHFWRVLFTGAMLALGETLFVNIKNDFQIRTISALVLFIIYITFLLKYRKGESFSCVTIS